MKEKGEEINQNKYVFIDAKRTHHIYKTRTLYHCSSASNSVKLESKDNDQDEMSEEDFRVLYLNGLMTDHKQHSKKQMKEAAKSIHPWDWEVITMKEIISILAEKLKSMV